MIIDYESKYTFPLTNDSLRQICGVNTTFDGISCGYGIFPPNQIHNSIDNISVGDWGINEYNIKDSPIRNILNDKWVNGDNIFFFYMLHQLLMFFVLTMQEN